MGIKYFILLVLTLLSGCAVFPPGFIYTNVTKPYSTDFNETTVGTKFCILEEYGISEPVSGNNISVTWSTDLIQTEAQYFGITTISYIEEHNVTLFYGIYHRRRLIIYGN